MCRMILPLLDMFANGPLCIRRDVRPVIREGRLYQEWVNPVFYSNPLELVKAAFEFFPFNHVTSCVNEFLEASPILTQWRRCMPSRIPQELWRWQQRQANISALNQVICEIGAGLSEGQILFHGGNLQSGVLENPISTTLCPQVALAETVRRKDLGGAVNIYIFRVVQSRTCVYVFNQSRGKFAHEKEVLFASGARIVVDPQYIEVPFQDIPGRIFNVEIA